MGGTDDPSNIVEVTVEEHAELHLDLYLQHGLMGDWLAYHTLSGQITAAEATRQAQIHANKTRVWSEESRKKISDFHKGRTWRKGAKLSDETKKKLSEAAKRRPPQSPETIEKIRRTCQLRAKERQRGPDGRFISKNDV